MSSSAPALQPAAAAGSEQKRGILRNGWSQELRALIGSFRFHQWSKNLLVFVPVLTSHTWHEPGVLLAAFGLCLAWSLAASGIYLINDLLDLESDRADEEKCHRPLASGRLSISTALIAAPVLLIAGQGIAFLISLETALVLLGYAILAQVYSAFLKKRLLLDVFTLALLYTLRVVGGGIATGNYVTIWLLAFASFLFLGLALLKRCAELIRRGDAADSSRAYRFADLPMIQNFGVASSFLSVLVLSLYVDSHVAESAYTRPQLLWAIVPLMLLWLCRLWMTTSRGEMHHDPIVFSMRDRGSWLIGFAVLAVLAVASIG